MKKILFLDRDGTLITEPADFQIDRLDKFALEPEVVPALRRLRDAGYTFVMVTNQDGLGTPSFREQEFRPLQNLLLDILKSQGVVFEAVRVCPHTVADRCDCRKPKVGLLLDYLKDTAWSREGSYVIGDRETDVRAGKRTLAVRFGRRGALAEYALNLALAHLVPLGLVLQGSLGHWGLLPCVTLPLGLNIFRRVAADNGRALNASLVRTAKLVFIHGILLAGGITLDALLG